MSVDDNALSVIFKDKTRSSATAEIARDAEP